MFSKRKTINNKHDEKQVQHMCERSSKQHELHYTAWQMNADTYCGYDIWNKGTVHIELNDYKDWRWVISYAYFLGIFSNSFEFSSVLYNHITIQINKIL